MKKEIEQEIEEKKQNIKDNEKYIEILDSFPKELYIKYLKINYDKSQENINLKKEIISIKKFQNMLYIFIFTAFLSFYINIYMV